MRTGRTLNTITSTTATTKATFSPPAAAAVQRSPWHSPVPYLFGGLAAMLGLIAFALLILACSYWKLSTVRQTNGNGDDGERGGDVENGDRKGEDSADVKIMPVFEEKIVVIMAGDLKPSFLATPVVSSRASAFGDHGNGKSGNTESDDFEKPKHDHHRNTTTTGNSNSGEDHETEVRQDQN